MSTETEEILEYAAKQFGSQQEETAMVAEIVEPTVETSQAAMANEEIQPNIETEEKPVIEQPVIEPTVVEPDYNKWLKEESGGVFTDVATFKESLPKISEYEALAQKAAELEKNQVVLANSFVKELNELALAGASQDQLKSFIKLNERGDLNELTPIEAKVAKLVLVDGYSEVVARKKVERDFPISDNEEDEEENQIVQDELRVSSKQDLEALRKYKTDLTTVVNPEKEQAEAQRLQQIARVQQHEQLVKQQAPKIASAIQGLGKISLNGKTGDEEVALDMPFPEEFKSTLTEKIENYFIETGDQITNETVDEALVYVKARYLAENFDKVVKSIYTHAESVIKERVSNKYENRSGLVSQEEPVVTINKQDDYNAFLERVAGVNK